MYGSVSIFLLALLIYIIYKDFPKGDTKLKNGILTIDFWILNILEILINEIFLCIISHLWNN